MLNRNEELKKYLVPGKHVHLVGIGGVSMRPLGLVLQGMGMKVTGSDMNASVSTDELIAKGIHVSIGHKAENVACNREQHGERSLSISALILEFRNKSLQGICERRQKSHKAQRHDKMPYTFEIIGVRYIDDGKQNHRKYRRYRNFSYYFKNFIHID